MNKISIKELKEKKNIIDVINNENPNYILCAEYVSKIIDTAISNNDKCEELEYKLQMEKNQHSMATRQRDKARENYARISNENTQIHIENDRLAALNREHLEFITKLYDSRFEGDKLLILLERKMFEIKDERG